MARSVSISLKKYDRGSSLNPERGGNLLRTPDPVHQIGGGVRAFLCGHYSRNRLGTSAGWLLVRVQPGFHVLHVVGDFARANARKRRAHPGPTPIDQTCDGNAEQGSNLFRRPQVDFVLVHLSTPKARGQKSSVRYVPIAGTTALPDPG